MIRSRAPVPRCMAFAALLLSLAAHARTFQGFVTHVTDGDSLWVRAETGGVPREVRLQGIDAPEICQAAGREARDALAGVALHRQVVVQTRARDRYQRIVARVFVGSHDVGGWLVARGYAWSDGYRGRGGPYASQQARAMASGLGLWAVATPMPPREFRRRHGSCH
jgi:micrococcal nuclease